MELELTENTSPISRELHLVEQELFYKTNSVGINFTPMDEYEVELGGILIKFVKQK